MCYAHRFFLYRLNFFLNCLRYSLTYWSILLLMWWSGSGQWLIINVIIIDATDIMSRRVSYGGNGLRLHMTWIMTFNMMVARRDLYVSPRTINRPVTVIYCQRCIGLESVLVVIAMTRRRQWFMFALVATLRCDITGNLYTPYWLTLNYFALHYYYYSN